MIDHQWLFLGLDLVAIVGIGQFAENRNSVDWQFDFNFALPASSWLANYPHTLVGNWLDFGSGCCQGSKTGTGDRDMPGAEDECGCCNHIAALLDSMCPVDADR